MNENLNGILNVYKEAGWTSFDVVAKLRGILKTKKNWTWWNFGPFCDRRFASGRWKIDAVIRIHGSGR
ncbi:hypothetical protein V425_04565 [Lactococcus lactis RTB018]|nr:hypothetical protein V425_04565 [Lactococcus lactis RTB018]